MSTGIDPDLQFSVLCDDVRIERSGKFIFVGVTNMIPAASLPARHPVFFVVNRWCNGEGEFREQSRVVNSGNEPVVQSAENAFVLKDTASVHSVVSCFPNVSFNEPGTYWVEVLLGGQLVRRYPFNVVKVEPKPKPKPEE